MLATWDIRSEKGLKYKEKIVIVSKKVHGQSSSFSYFRTDIPSSLYSYHFHMVV